MYVIRPKLEVAGILLALSFAPAQALGAPQATDRSESAPAPEAYYFRLDSAEAAFERGDMGEVARLARELTAADPVDGDLWAGYGVAAARTGQAREAVRAFERAFELGTPYQSFVAVQTAALHARLGDRQAAYAWIRRALDARFEDRVRLQEMEAFEPYHDDPEFRRLAGLPPDGAADRDARWRYDLDFLVAEARRLHPGPDRPAFSDAFRDRASELRRRISQLTDDEIAVELQRLVVLLGDGHSVVYGIPYRADRASRLAWPVIFYRFEDGLFIVDAAEPHRNLLGARVERFGSMPAERVLGALEPYVNRDNPMTINWLGVRFFMRSPSYLKAIGATDRPDSVDLEVRLPDGGSRSVTLAAAPDTFPRKLRAPARAALRDGAGSTPLWLRDVGSHYWTEPLPGHGALYVQFNQVLDAEDRSLAEFSADLRRELEDMDARTLIMDVRHNNGGSNGLLTPLLRTMIHFEISDPERRIFVITGRGTFSAAQNFINQVERLTDAVFVGEPSSSRPNFVGEGTEVVLPYSRLWASLSSRYWQDSNPGDHRPWIAPDVPVRLSSADYFGNHDPALTAILRILD